MNKENLQVMSGANRIGRVNSSSVFSHRPKRDVLTTRGPRDRVDPAATEDDEAGVEPGARDSSPLRQFGSFRTCHSCTDATERSGRAIATAALQNVMRRSSGALQT